MAKGSVIADGSIVTAGTTIGAAIGGPVGAGVGAIASGIICIVKHIVTSKK